MRSAARAFWRILHEVDLKPHKSAYWLNSPDEDFDAKARTICQLYAQALDAYRQGHMVICCDEKLACKFSNAKSRPPLLSQGDDAHSVNMSIFGMASATPADDVSERRAESLQTRDLGFRPSSIGGRK